MTATREAAENVFAPQGLTIDVLHIDADHSFEACLDDFCRYVQYLRVGLVVTLHDRSFPGAGVCHVVQHLRTRGDCEVIDFPDMGAGTAIVRMIEDRFRATVTPRRYGNDGDAIVLTRKSENVASAPPSIGWRYLKTDAVCSRCVLAAHFVRECPTVIEIGGGRTPIDGHLTGRHRSVIVIDPFLHEHRRSDLNGAPCGIWHVRARFQDIEWRIEKPGDYGLVLLGLDLPGLSEADERMLCMLVDNARTTVVEFSTSWSISRELYELIRRNTATRICFTCKLDLAGNDIGDMANSWPPRFDREVHVLEPIGAR